MDIVKNIKKNSIILFIITVAILFIVLKDNFGEIVKVISSMDLKYIIVAILFFFIHIFLKSVVNFITVNDKEKISLKEAFKHDVITQFFNGVTPFSTGGQPMEIYMLTEHDISVARATNISIQNFIFYQTALVIFGLFAVVYNRIFRIFPNAPLLRKLVLIGFLVNTLVAVGLFLILVSKSITKKIAEVTIDILAKLKLIKKNKVYKVKKDINNKLEEFHESAKLLRERKGLFVTGVILHLVSLACLYIIPLFLVWSLRDFTSISAMEAITSSAYVLLIGAFVPIPGASGGIEFGFMQFFGNFISGESLSAILLAWRFITYYLAVIAGALAFNLEKKVD